MSKYVYIVKHTGGIVAYREVWIGSALDEAISVCRGVTDDTWTQKGTLADWQKDKERVFVSKRKSGYKSRSRKQRKIDNLLERNASLQAMIGASPRMKLAEIKKEMKSNIKQINKIDPNFLPHDDD